MRLSPSRLAFGVALFLLASPAARGQISWQITHSDGTLTPGTAGIGFADGTYASGTSGVTRGELRYASAQAAANYLGTILDGRGTVTLNFNASNTSGANALASFGTSYATEAGSFSTGLVYQRAVSNTTAFSSPQGSGRVDFGYDWHYGVTGTNTTLANGTYDLVSVLAHEFGHALGFASISGNKPLIANLGKGSANLPLGTADTYSNFDRFLQKGNANGSGALFRTDISANTYGSFNPAGSAATYTGGNSQTFDGTNTNVTNNTTDGLYFNGQYAREVFGGAVPIYSPATYELGSSGSHVNVGTTGGYGSGAVGLMNYAIADNTQRRFQAYEIAMLLDMGWNTYNWNASTTGTWAAGETNLANSNWRSQGITLGDSATGFTRYNKFATPDQAPILPVYGQTTANIVLNFGGDSYTMTNDVGTVRLSRMNFTNSGAVILNGGGLNFGENAAVGGVVTASVLVPKIIQNGAGSVTINSAIQVNNIATQELIGSIFTGHSGLTVEGTGAGTVTLGGNITGTGGLTKNGSTFNLIVSGSSSYTGNTVVNAGTLEVRGSIGSATAGQTFVDGSTAILAGGTGSGSVGQVNTANVSVVNGGTIRPDSANGTNKLTVRNVAFNGGAKLAINLGTAGTSSGLNFGGASLNFNADNTSSVVKLTGLTGLTRPVGTASWTLGLDLGTGGLKVNSAVIADGATIGLFTATGATTGNNTGDVTLDISAIGFNFNVGDTLALKRSGNTLVLDFQPVPEPATVLAVGAAGLGAITWLRRRRKVAAETPTAA